MPDHAAMKVHHQLNGAYWSGFVFVEAEKRFRQLSNHREVYVHHLGGEISPAWSIWWFPAALAAIGLGVFEAFTAQGAIAGLVDPSGEGIIPSYVLALIGVTLAIVGITLGHLMHESFQTHPYSGQRSITAGFWLYLLAALFYVGFQYYISKTAGGETSKEHFIGLQNMPMVVAGIATIELLYGIFLADRVIAYMLLFTTTVRQRRATRQMNKNARSTHNAYGYYISLLEEYNRTGPGGRMEREGNTNIRRAIAYYSGIALSSEQSANDFATRNSSRDNQSVRGGSNRTAQGNNETSGTPNSDTNRQSDLESFLDDNIDDDLKV